MFEFPDMSTFVFNNKKVEESKMIDFYDLVITDNNLIEISDRLKKLTLKVENLII